VTVETLAAAKIVVVEILPVIEIVDGEQVCEVALGGTGKS